MAKRNSDDLSSLVILAISMAIAVIGFVAYVLVTPMSPAQRVAAGHSAVSEPVIR